MNAARSSAALVGALLSTIAFAQVDRALFFHVAQSLVKVEVVNERGGLSLGSGVVIAPGKAVTNCHVTRDAAHIHALWGGVRYRVNAQASDLRRDLCLLLVPALDSPAATIGSAGALKLGQPILAAGFVGGLGLQAQPGEVSALHLFDGSRVIQSTTAFTSGASGGGLFNAQGRLVGILTFRLRGAQRHYYSTPVEWISGALMDAHMAGRVAPLSGAIAFWQASGAALPFFLQAAPLEAAQQWNELVRLTDRWSSEDRANPEAWFTRGIAYTELKRTEAAIKAFRRAVELDPLFDVAWFKLGRAYFQTCQSAELQKVSDVLTRLNRELFERLRTPDAAQPKTLRC